MQTSNRVTSRRLAVVAALVLLSAAPASAQGVLSVEIVNGYNLIVDSNVTAPSTYAPRSAYIGAQVCNTGDAALDNVTAYVGNYATSRTVSVTTVAGSTTITSAAGFLPTSDGGLSITGTGIPNGTTIAAIANTSSATLSAPATVSGVNTLTLSAAAGSFPVTTFGSDPNPLRFHLANTGPYSLSLEVGTGTIEDGTRYIGTLAAGECRIQYWLFSYPACVNVNGAPQEPPCDVSIAGGVKAEDDLSLDYDVWATTTTGIASPTVVETREFFMRNEISAAANKIWPNTASKVPDEYLAAIQGVVGWGTLGPDGQPLSSASAVYPGQRVITTQGIWYDLGNVVHGFDNNGDLIPDVNAWLQPVGDPASFDSGCFRMVNVYGIVIAKLVGGGEMLIPFQNQLYHENLPDNTGVVGLVYYQYIATREGCAANMTPYQEAASGFDNEKFSGDYGLNLPLESRTFDGALTLTKTDGNVTVAAPATLTYTITATNISDAPDVHLGAPDLGTPLVFRETIPTGTVYVGGSAVANLTEPTGTGSLTQDYTDLDGNVDSCAINYTIASSSYVVFYSTDGGTTWVLTEPTPANVTDLRFMLMTTLQQDGGHDRNACVAPDGDFTDATDTTVETSLPAGTIVTDTPTTASFTVAVTVANSNIPVICNTVKFGFGPAASNTTAQDCTLLQGPNSIAGTVFEDDGGTGAATYGNGTIDDATEVGIGAGVLVTLYYDANADGLSDENDIAIATTTTSATGTYAFTGLPDGNFVVTIKKYDGSASVTTTSGSTTVTTTSGAFSDADVGSTITGTGIPGGATIVSVVSANEIVISANATASGTVTAFLGDGATASVDEFLATRAANANDTQGWGNTTFDPNQALTTDSGILKLNEAQRTASLAISIDLDHSNALDQSDTTLELDQINFGFAPPFQLTKTVSATTVDEGEVFAYTIVLENRLPSVGVQGPTGCQYTAWAPSGTNGSPAQKEFANYLDALDGPNRQVASALVVGGGLKNVTGTGFRLADQAGSITKVEGLIFGYYSTPLSDDFLSLQMTLGGNTSTTTIPTAAIDTYVGVPADLNPNSAISWDATSARPGGGSWTFADDFSAVAVNVNPSKASSADQRTFFLDAIGLRITTNADCVAGPSTTLSPVPLQDRFDATVFTYVSATPAPDSISGGTLQWNDVGPLVPGTSNVVTVYLLAPNVSGTQTGDCSTTSAPSTPPPAGSQCNLVETEFDGRNVYYADGRLANDDDDKVPVNVIGKAELHGIVWRDTDNDGWPIDGGEPGLPNVSVSLFGCVDQADGVSMLTGVSNSQHCVQLGGAWEVIATTATSSTGTYDFIGLDSGYYIVQVGDTDGVVTTAGTAPYSMTQTAEPNDNQASTSGAANGTTGVCAGVGGCNGTWGDSTVSLRSDQTTINFLSAATEEIVTGINFGYFSNNALIYGNTWHDVDGDGTRDTGDGDLDDFVVRLYLDADNDNVADPGELVQTTTTDAFGNYAFGGLAAEDYIVVVTPETLPNNVWSLTDEAAGTPGGTGDTTEDNILFVTVVAGDISGSHDFGYTLTTTSNIGDTVYIDLDSDGVQDDGEMGISDVTVWLYSDIDRDGTIDEGVDEILQTDVTDAAGNYLFTDLPEGSYIVKVDRTDPDFPADVTATADPDVQMGTIGDRVWFDADEGEDEDAGEDGVPGVVVLLYVDDGDGVFSASSDQLVTSTTTNITGYYTFPGLTAGNYFVDIDETTLPLTSLVLTTPDSTGMITLVSNTATYDAVNSNFGVSPPNASGYAIGNRVWHDVDNDGVQDAGEVGLPGIDITVTGTGCSPCTATTDNDGFWYVDGLTDAAVYSVALDDTDLPRDFIATTGTTDPRNVTISSADNMAVDFGYRYNPAQGTSPTGTISGSVFLDADGDRALDSGEAFDGTVVNLLDGDGVIVASTTTNSSGAYSFTGVFIGDYVVQAVNAYGIRYSTLFLSSTTGFPNLNVIYDNTISTTPDDQSSVSVDGVHDNLLQDFGYRVLLGSIGDTVYWDANRNGTQDVGEPGFAGVDLTLYDCTWTDSNSNFIFEDGEDTACVSAGTTTTTADDPLTAADEGGKYLFSNLADTATGHYYVVVVDTADLPGTLGSTLFLTADPETDGAVCTDLPLTDDPDDEFPPDEVCDSKNLVQVFRGGLNYLGADFGYDLEGVAGYGKLGDHVWIDTDADGLKDAGEPGIPNITVWLDTDNDNTLDWTDANGNDVWDSGEGERWTETDGDGYYLFTGLAASTTYNVRVADTTAEDADWPTGLTQTFEVRLNNTGANSSLDGHAQATLDANAVISSIVDGDPDTTSSCATQSLAVATTLDSTTVTSVGLFTDNHLGLRISGTGIPTGATIVSVTSANAVVISAAATATGSITASLIGCEDLDVDFGYRYDPLVVGSNALSGTICIESTTSGSTFGNCGDTDADTSGITAGTESALAGVSVYLYLWTDDGDNTGWDAGTGVLDSGDTFTLLGSTSTDSNGDYSFSNVPDNVVVVFGVPASQNLTLNTTGEAIPIAGHTSVEDGGVLNRQFYEGTSTYEGNTVTVVARQALNLAGDADNDVVDLDFAFDNTLGGTITYDFGDLPDSTFGATTPDYDATMLASGARHRIGSVMLGTAPIAETDGDSSSDATGDVEEDGVSLVGGVMYNGVYNGVDAGGAVDVTVTTEASYSGTPWLSAWFDFNGDGDFADDGERIYNGPVTGSTGGTINTITFDVPLTALEDTYYSRFRVYSEEPLLVSATGVALSTTFAPVEGEVEDFAFALTSTVATIKSFRALDTRKGVAIDWETGSEIGTIGFDLRRRDPESGDFVTLNDALLPAVKMRQQGGRYRYLDQGALPSTTYEYDLIEVEASGRRHRYGPFAVNTAWTDGPAYQALAAQERKETKPGFSGEDKRRGERSAIKKNKVAADTTSAANGKAKGKKAVAAPGAKIGVTGPGMHYVSLADLADSGGLSVDARSFGPGKAHYALNNGGDVVAYMPALDGSGLLFYGQAIDSIYTNENVYQFAPDPGRATTIPSRRERGTAQPRGDEVFTRRIHVEQDLFQADAVSGDPEADTWLWEWVWAGWGSASFTFRTDGVSGGIGREAVLRVRLYGVSDTAANPDHHAVFRVNGHTVGDVEWNSTAPVETEVRFDASYLQDGDNTLEVEGLITEAPYSVFFMDEFDVAYPSRYRAYGNRLEASTEGNRAVELSGFTRPDIAVFDVTDPRHPIYVEGTVRQLADTSYGVTLTPDRAGTVYYAMTPDAISNPSRVWPDRPSTLRSGSNNAEYVIVTAPGLEVPAQRLADYRSDLGSLVVDIEDVYDEFSNGIASPHALKAFLAHAWSNWAAAPRYVVLAGDGSLDYRNVTGAADNLVPTMRVATASGLAPSDAWFAELDPSSFGPELTIGRLPAANAPELDAIVDKIVAREASLGESWVRDVVMTADNADRGGDFPADADWLASQVASGTPLEKIYISTLGAGPARQRLLQRFQEGAGLINYVGHGGFDLLADEGLLMDWDVYGMTNLNQPVVTAMTCLAGHFALPGYPSIGEELLRKQSGGAAAVWSATALSQNHFAVILAGGFQAAAVSGQPVRVGDAIAEALRRYEVAGGPSYLLSTYALLGDPAMWLR